MGFALLALLSMVAPLPAQQTNRSRGTPIIFSAPKSDTVSSNLNELRTPTAPFRDLEADLKKPFEIFDPNSSDKLLRSRDQKFKTPPPDLNKKQLKEQLHERAEQMFLSLEPEDDDPFKASEESFDPYNKKPKTSLDRYYDRLDRNRVAVTNRTSVNDLFGDKKDKEKERRDESGFDKKKPIGFSDDERSVTSRNVRLMSNSSPTGDSLFSEKNKARGSGEMFDSGKQISFYERNKTKSETRLEEYKRLLDGPGYGHDTREKVKPVVSAYETAAPQAIYGAAAPTWSSTKPAAKTPPANTFATSAGLVGTPAAPQGLKDFDSAASLSTPPPKPPPAKPAKPSTFNIPKRRF